MNTFRIVDYIIAKHRDGQTDYYVNKALKEFNDSNEDNLLVIYRDDVYTYYYSVPKRYKDKIAYELLEFFYEDNYDYSDEQLIDFKNLYPEFFNQEAV